MVQHIQPHLLFPVQMQAKWCREKTSQLNLYLQDWLLDPSSLTARLKQHCQEFRVQVLGQHIENCSLEESNEDIIAGEKVLVREVLLFCDEKPQVFARSLLPLSSLTGNEAQLAKLGEQSLGQILFNHPDLKRKGIEVASFDQHSTVAKLANHYELSVLAPLWGRRSVFVVDNKPLMVAEVFLPNSYAYQQRKTENEL
jgi:chorismate lyase